MNTDQHMAVLPAVTQWSMPIVPEHYDRRPLTAEERQALDFLKNRQAHGGPDPRSKEARAARSTLDRLNQPVVDVFRLRSLQQPRRTLEQSSWRTRANR